jgi:hypothetical protein
MQLHAGRVRVREQDDPRQVENGTALLLASPDRCVHARNNIIADALLGRHTEDNCVFVAEISVRRALRPAFSQAIIVLADPANKSNIRSPALLLFKSALLISSTGFMVGCMRFAAGLFSSQSVDWLLSPYQASL